MRAGGERIVRQDVAGVGGGDGPAGLDAGRAHHLNNVMALASLPGGLLASGSYDCTVRVWEVESGRLVRALAGHTAAVSALAGLPAQLRREI